MKPQINLSRKRRMTILAIALTLPFLAGDTVLIVRGTTPLAEIALPFVLSFAVFTALYVIARHKGGEKIEHDERSLRIEGRAFAYSWYLSLRDCAPDSKRHAGRSQNELRTSPVSHLGGNVGDIFHN